MTALPESPESQFPAEETEAPESSKWYVIHTYSGYENKVKRNLEHRIDSMGMKNKIFSVVVPEETEITIQQGQRKTVNRKMFPGYVLVNMIELLEREVKTILKQTEAEAPKVKPTFTRGQNVRIIDGPFAEFIGVVDEVSAERNKVKVLVSFFGRETPVELDFLQVEKL